MLTDAAEELDRYNYISLHVMTQREGLHGSFA